MKQNDFMKKAALCSIQNIENKGGPFGAVIIQNNKIIATGVNRVVPNHDPTAHAEIQAIRMACKKLKTFDLSDCEIYTSCEPCPMCLGAIYWAKIKKVYYANTRIDAASIDFDDDFIYNEIAKPIENRSVEFIKMESEEAKAAFLIWKDINREMRY